VDCERRLGCVVTAIEASERLEVASKAWFLWSIDVLAGFSSRPVRARFVSAMSHPKQTYFFNCVGGSIFMTWCEWLVGNVTSGLIEKWQRCH
jgi:hypothetical protein